MRSRITKSDQAAAVTTVDQPRLRVSTATRCPMKTRADCSGGGASMGAISSHSPTPCTTIACARPWTRSTPLSRRICMSRNSTKLLNHMLRVSSQSSRSEVRLNVWTSECRCSPVAGGSSERGVPSKSRKGTTPHVVSRTRARGVAADQRAKG